MHRIFPVPSSLLWVGGLVSFLVPGLVNQFINQLVPAPSTPLSASLHLVNLSTPPNRDSSSTACDIADSAFAIFFCVVFGPRLQPQSTIMTPNSLKVLASEGDVEVALELLTAVPQRNPRPDPRQQSSERFFHRASTCQ